MISKQLIINLNANDISVAGSEWLTEIPHLELNVVVLHRLHVEPNRCINTTHAIISSNPPTPTKQSKCTGKLVNQNRNSLGIVETTSPICSRSARPKPNTRIRIEKHSDGTKQQIRGGPADTRQGSGEKGGAILTQNGGLASIVEAEDEDAGLAVAEDRREEPREYDPHSGAAKPHPRGGAKVPKLKLGVGWDLMRGGKEGAEIWWEGVSWRARVSKTTTTTTTPLPFVPNRIQRLQNRRLSENH
jgi:hypothetical protein